MNLAELETKTREELIELAKEMGVSGKKVRGCRPHTYARGGHGFQGPETDNRCRRRAGGPRDIRIRRHA